MLYGYFRLVLSSASIQHRARSAANPSTARFDDVPEENTRRAWMRSPEHAQH